MKIVLCGPPRSGKSCLREGLKQAILALVRERGIELYPYIITGCPDGEGAWFQETVNRSPEEAAAHKAAYKSRFTPEFVKRVADSVRSCQLPLTLVDIGGIPSIENEAICASATHVILLAGDLSRLPEWREFSALAGFVTICGKDQQGNEVVYEFYKQPQVVIAEIDSDYHGSQDVVEGVGDDGILRGSVHHLERGEPVADRPMIRALAEHLVKLATAQDA